MQKKQDAKPTVLCFLDSTFGAYVAVRSSSLDTALQLHFWSLSPETISREAKDFTPGNNRSINLATQYRRLPLRPQNSLNEPSTTQLFQRVLDPLSPTFYSDPFYSEEHLKPDEQDYELLVVESLQQQQERHYLEAILLLLPIRSKADHL